MQKSEIIDFFRNLKNVNIAQSASPDVIIDNRFEIDFWDNEVMISADNVFVINVNYNDISKIECYSVEDNFSEISFWNNKNEKIVGIFVNCVTYAKKMELK